MDSSFLASQLLVTAQNKVYSQMIADKMLEEKPTIPGTYPLFSDQDIFHYSDQQTPLKTNKVILPIRRTQKNENLIVGVVTYQELEATAENSNGCLNQSKSLEKNEEIAPPAVVLMNFARDTVVNKTGRLDEVIYQTLFFMNIQKKFFLIASNTNMPNHSPRIDWILQFPVLFSPWTFVSRRADILEEILVE